MKIHGLLCASALLLVAAIPALGQNDFSLNRPVIQLEAPDLAALPLFGDAPRYITYDEFYAMGGKITQLGFVLPEVFYRGSSEVTPSLHRILAEGSHLVELVGVYEGSEYRPAVVLIE